MPSLWLLLALFARGCMLPVAGTGGMLHAPAAVQPPRCSPHSLASALGAELAGQAAHASVAVVSSPFTVPGGHALQPLSTKTPVVTPSSTGKLAWKPPCTLQPAESRMQECMFVDEQRGLMITLTDNTHARSNL